MYLLPKPHEINYEDGYFLLGYEVKIVMSFDCTDAILQYAGWIESDIKKYAGVESTKRKSFTAGIGDIKLLISRDLPQDVYTLEINASGIEIKGRSQVEILYGIQTLRQIIRQEGARLPFLAIYDYPEMKNRGFFHDVTRGRVPKLEFLKELADKLSYYKINQFQLYIEHSFMFDGLSEMWRDDTPLTAEDILELDAYCAAVNIELVPSLASFGHLYKLLRTKSFAELCELPDSSKDGFSFSDRMQHHTLNVTSEDSIKLIERLILEFIPLFRSNKFNICADETFDLGEGFSKARKVEIGKENLYVGFVSSLCDILIRQGKQPMIWGDIICGFPEMTARLPKEIIYLTWGYAADEKEYTAKKMQDQNVTQYLCPGVGGWNQLINTLDSSYRNIRAMSEYAYRFKAAGILNTDWGDYGHINHPAFSTPGMIYGAAFSWNSDYTSYDDINRQISRIEYEDYSEKICGLMGEFAKLNPYNWYTAVNYSEKYIKGFSYDECKEFFMSQIELLKQVKEANEKIEELKTELAECCKYLRENRKAVIEPILIAAEGMKLLNETGSAVAIKEYGLALEEGQNISNISDELERWFMHYKRLWRTVSRESELYRIQNVIFWYADFLRK